MPRKSVKKPLRDNITGIKNPSIKRIATQAGIKSLSGEIYEEVRGKIKAYVETMLQRVSIYLEHAGKKTVTTEDVSAATSDTKYYHDGGGCGCCEDKKYDGKRSPKTESLNLQIQRLPFFRYLKEVAQDLNTSMKFSEGAVDAIQALTENHVRKLLRGANIIANHSGRTTVTSKDLNVRDEVCL